MSTAPKEPDFFRIWLIGWLFLFCLASGLVLGIVVLLRLLKRAHS